MQSQQQTTNHKQRTALRIPPYIKFLLKSQNQHGLHSPFVYDLVTKCFYDKNYHPEYELLETYRKELLQNKQKIKVTDFGAGSKVFSSDTRAVSAIAKHVGIPKKRARFLFRLVKYLNCQNILELGTSLGIGTAALAANKWVNVISLEGCPQTAKIAQQQLAKFGLKNAKVKIGEFEKLLPLQHQTTNRKQQTTNSHPKPDNPQQRTENRQPRTPNHKQQTIHDLIYFDGNHTREATLDYFEKLLPTSHNDSVFVFDDIHWSPGMEAAWEEIKAHLQVTVSIDTYYLGLIFFRKEQAKQHFKIRL
ncbi:Methyltransferase domain-containing protein [Salegentibacter echinorum]|uniref:Methyltransferase domain-containing protein n=1 Tax=Salegentibacter echinorum TaxID=1073325 RepID=A0A1M5JVF3_SALEC|nr:class I SAM-dependent methyltransferase [Salegentibacter echinorum]SHG43973.1 Methyltransferase domain-containing protein [Salegentibacter echinorum]